MFDVSWGEFFVLSGLGITLIGRKDLPVASRMLGTQLGRVVGLLQGARARADRFTANNELRQLQNELRSGLRELDAVKSELAVAAGSGFVGRGLGSTVAGANRPRTIRQGSAATASSTDTGHAFNPVPPPVAPSSVEGDGSDFLAAARAATESSDAPPPPSPLDLAPRNQSVAAVAEEEWEKQGIGFKSRAERGTGVWDGMGSLGSYGGTPSGGVPSGGSVILADLLQQVLIHDQYDRAVQEQDDVIRSRAEKMQKDRASASSAEGKPEP